MKSRRRLVSLLPFAASLVALALVACAAPVDEEAGDQGAAQSSRETSREAGAPTPSKPAAELIALGKYVDPSKGVLLVRGRASEDNLLANQSGLAVAYGTLGDDGRTLRTPEGDVCGAYTLSQVPGRLTVDVLWQAEGSVARDPEIAKGCMELEGTYEMTESGE